MARRKIDEENIRSLTRTGRGKSLGLTLPVQMLRQLKWRERQKLVVKLRGKKLVIEDWKMQKIDRGSDG